MWCAEGRFGGEEDEARISKPGASWLGYWQVPWLNVLIFDYAQYVRSLAHGALFPTVSRKPKRPLSALLPCSKKRGISTDSSEGSRPGETAARGAPHTGGRHAHAVAERNRHRLRPQKQSRSPQPAATMRTPGEDYRRGKPDLEATSGESEEVGRRSKALGVAEGSAGRSGNPGQASIVPGGKRQWLTSAVAPAFGEALEDSRDGTRTDQVRWVLLRWRGGTPASMCASSTGVTSSFDSTVVPFGPFRTARILLCAADAAVVPALRPKFLSFESRPCRSYWPALHPASSYCPNPIQGTPTDGGVDGSPTTFVFPHRQDGTKRAQKPAASERGRPCPSCRVAHDAVPRDCCNRCAGRATPGV